MLKNMLIGAAFVVVGLGSGHAATYEFSFNQAVVSFPFDLWGQGGRLVAEDLPASYGRMTVSDAADGVDLKFSINPSFEGALDTLYFDYIPAFSQLVKQRYIYDPVPPEGQFYFHSISDVASGHGTSYSWPDWRPVTSLLSIDASRIWGNEFTIQFRHVPGGVSAASFVPKYLTVRETVGVVKAEDGNAYLLASPVPEPGTAALLLLGSGMLAVMAGRRQLSSKA